MRICSARARVAWSPAAPTPHLQGRSMVSVKEAQALILSAAPSDSWLLPVCAGNVGSSSLRPHDGIRSEAYRGSYSRVFVMDCTDRKVEELRLTAEA